MKKSIMILVASLFMTSAFLTSCNSPAEKVEDAKSNVVEAQANLDKANEELLVEVANYRKEIAVRIAVYPERIDHPQIRAVYPFGIA